MVVGRYYSVDDDHMNCFLCGTDMYFAKKVISSPALTQALRLNLHIGYIGLTITETMTFYFNDIQGGLAVGSPFGFQ